MISTMISQLLLPVVSSFCLTLSPCHQPKQNGSETQELVVWNVGQGLWTTWISETECWHFDLGGERKQILNQVSELCRRKRNRLFLSHWDLDHVGFIPHFRRQVNQICLAVAPEGETSPRKKSWLEGLEPCGELPGGVKNLWNSPPSAGHKGGNHESHVFQLELSNPGTSILIPGDSTSQEEKFWALRVSAKVKGLILGHHGSQTSTSEILLDHLRNLKWAIASSRKKRYGHPHAVIVERLKKRKIPLLKTEDWGSFHFLN